MPKIADKNPAGRKTGQQMRTRVFAAAPSTVDSDARSFEAILTTETPVRTKVYTPTGCIEVDEVLVSAGLDLSRSRGMPLLDSHNQWALEHYLGRVDDAWVGDTEHGDSVLIRASLTPSRAGMMQDIEAGYYNNMSAGFVVNNYEFEQRDGDVPIARATSWTLIEASIVPIGADPNASIRSNRPDYPFPEIREIGARSMDYTEAVAAAEAAIAAAEEAVAAIPAEAGDADEATVERAAAAVKRMSEVDDKEERADDTADEAANDNDASDAGDAAATKEEVDSVRSIAKSYGKDAVKIVDDLAALGASAVEIRSAVRGAVLKRSAGTIVPESVEPKTPETRTAGASKIDVRGIYAGMNNR